MARHRRPLPPAPAPGIRARGQLAACLLAMSALAATLLATTVEPDAPSAPDRTPNAVTAEVPRLPED
ncbi:hypothetical protein [Streptomyces cyaneofuscatus]|uniref:hypothetical protein n=1 Tax=Streptomyces cyaneofuscatus TaxID=66883 RepID=UPI003437BAE3